MFPFRRSTSVEYVPLESSSDPLDVTPVTKPKNGLPALIVYWASIIIVVCAVVDAAAFAALAAIHFARQGTLQASRVEDLPFRSPYVGLDELYMKSDGPVPHYEPIFNVPRLIVQLDTSTQPVTVLPTQKEYVRTDHGMVLVNHRRFLVQPKISTVAQFRIMDFGMEKCNLQLTFPEESGGFSDTLISPQSVHVDVWKLNTDTVLKEGDLFNAPRETLAGTVVVAYGSNHSLPFECKSGSLYTFEFCSKNGEVITKADRQELIGPYVIQYQSI